MGTIREPTEALLKRLVAPYLKTQDHGLVFAIGFAGPSFTNKGSVYLFGKMQNQFGDERPLDKKKTLFEIASITKTFTATLYALRVRGKKHTVGDFMKPNGPFTNRYLADIKLDQLVNYTSGLPQDNDDARPATPRFWPQPYSLQGMIGFLNARPPQLLGPGKRYAYSNLGFAIMSAIIASDGKDGVPSVHAFTRKMRECIFEPLGLDATFFNEACLARLPLGFKYDYWPSPSYSYPGYSPKAPGHLLYPAYFGSSGIVATADDMLKWLKFNMGIIANKNLTPLLSALHQLSTKVTTLDKDNPPDGSELGLSWFIDAKERPGWSKSINKDGTLDASSSYMGFLPSSKPGKYQSQAGAFVLVNANGIKDQQTVDGVDIAEALTNYLLLYMQNEEPVWPTGQSAPSPQK
jgi:CubicO group peptidase (beta-lactamase class C family)